MTRSSGPRRGRHRPPEQRGLTFSGGVAAGLIGISLVNGAFEPSFGARVADLQNLLAADPARIAIPLAAYPVGLAVGGLAAMALIGLLGARGCLLVGVAIKAIPLILIAALVGHVPADAMLWTLAVLWGVAGLGNGLVDPAHAGLAAALPGGRMHNLLLQAVKMFGTLIAALAAFAVVGMGIGVGPHLLVVGTVALVVGVLSARLLPAVRDRAEEEVAQRDVGFVGLSMIGLLAGCSAIPLGAALNWSTSILTEIGAPRPLVGLGLVAFATAQMVGLAASWFLSGRVRSVRIVSVGSVIATAGIAALGVAAQLADGLPTERAVALVTAGFLLLGIGVAPISALAHRAATHVRARRVPRLARVGAVVTFQYVLQGVGPVLIGFAGAAFGVTSAFVVVCFACITVLVLGRHWFRHAERPLPKGHRKGRST